MRLAFLALALVCSGGVEARARAAAAQPVKHPLSVAEVIAQAPTAGRLLLTGFVVRLYLCPPCPAGAVCKPCVGDHVVLSDDRHRLGPADDLGTADVMIWGERAALQRLRVGSRYDLDVAVEPTRAGGRPVNDLKLVVSRRRD